MAAKTNAAAAAVGAPALPAIPTAVVLKVGPVPGTAISPMSEWPVFEYRTAASAGVAAVVVKFALPEGQPWEWA